MNIKERKKGPKYNKVLEDFKVNLSYTKTGRLNNLSRQRIEQIVKESGIGIKAKSAHGLWIGGKCQVCDIPLTKENHKFVYCLKCYAHKLHVESKERRRT